ncbi:glycoside hydrolase superfamily [Chiua virens]|nr:glycoside hydrolase superfamily [Chiua virens]
MMVMVLDVLSEPFRTDSLVERKSYKEKSKFQATSLSLAGRHEPARVAAAWYTGWHASEGFPLSTIPWNNYNTLIYSFAITTPSVHHLSLNGSAPSLLPEFVKEAHANHVAAHIAIGGWTGGVYFSSNLATPENRTAFVHTVAHFAEKHDLDGINFDWEYPNHQGVGCNIISAKDTENFLSFLQELRAHHVGAKLTLSAATSIVPFSDAFGKPSTDVSGFAKVLDYIAIMNYDIWGSWFPNVGPNAPLKDACAASADQQGSAVSAVKAWTAAGMPVDKIVLGVASYGHSFRVAPSDAFVKDSQTKLVPYPKFNASRQPLGDAWDSVSEIDPCGVNEGPEGIYNLWGLVVGGFLDRARQGGAGYPLPL